MGEIITGDFGVNETLDFEYGLFAGRGEGAEELVSRMSRDKIMPDWCVRLAKIYAKEIMGTDYDKRRNEENNQDNVRQLSELQTTKHQRDSRCMDEYVRQL